MPEILVIDASVAAKWFRSDEEELEPAADLLITGPRFPRQLIVPLSELFPPV